MAYAARACALAAALTAQWGAAAAATLPQTVVTIKPSIVGIGTWMPTRSPAISFFATGFAVGDGLSVISNAHALPVALDDQHQEVLGVVTGSGSNLQFRPATLAAVDKEHDLMLLRLSGAALPALRLGDSASRQEGDALAFTGFPLGMSLGMQPVTHRATLSAITPILLPALNAHQLDARAVSQQRRAPFAIFQHDGTAYPGNSGSPVYDPDDGVVYGVINMTVLKQLKENAIGSPSGISYAIPSSFVQALLRQNSEKKN